MLQKNKLLSWLPFIICVGVVLFFPWPIDHIRKLRAIYHSIDKIIHIFLYTGLSLWALTRFQYAHQYSLKRSVVMTIGLIIFCAVADELHQLLVPGRRWENLDLVSDGFGLSCGLIIGIVLIKFRKTRPSPIGLYDQ